MADAPVVHVGEGSPEHIAYKLFLEIARLEDVDLAAGASGTRKPDRAWIYQTYGECLRAVRSPVAASEGKFGAG